MFLKSIKRKILFLLASTIFTASLMAQGVLVVPLANKDIKYKAKIYSSDFRLVQADEKKYRCKKYLDINLLKQNKYYAKHFIKKNKPICEKSVFIPQIGSIRFKFGNLEIEREGTIIRETDTYIRIKNPDGTIDKIYKDGRKTK